jgi:hypothetical protein
MDDAAVVPRLMPGEPVFRLEDERDKATLRKSQCRCDADDSTANHYNSIAT